MNTFLFKIFGTKKTIVKIAAVLSINALLFIVVDYLEVLRWFETVAKWYEANSEEIFTVKFWGGDDASLSVVIRSLGLLILGIIALILAAIRTSTATRQTNLSERGQNTERFQKAAAMLGDELLSLREAGIFALEELAKQDPKNHFMPVQKLLCAFIRDRSDQQRAIKGEDATSKATDINEALASLAAVRKAVLWFFVIKAPVNINDAYFEECIAIGAQLQSIVCDRNAFKKENFDRADFRHGSFSEVDFTKANLEKTDFSRAKANKGNFQNIVGIASKWRHANLRDSNFERAFIIDAVVYGANFSGSNLSKSNISFANAYLITLPLFTRFVVLMSMLITSTYIGLHALGPGSIDYNETTISWDGALYIVVLFLVQVRVFTSRLANNIITSITRRTPVVNVFLSRDMNFSFTNIQGINAQSANFLFADFSRSQMRNSTLQNTNFWRADFAKANLDEAGLCGAILNGANFSQATVTGTRLEKKWKHLFTLEQWKTVGVIDKKGNIVREPETDG